MMANSGLEESSVDIRLLLEPESDDYDTETVEEVTVHKLSEEELAQFLVESGDDELFNVPADSVQPLFISFLQRAVKLVRFLGLTDITSPQLQPSSQMVLSIRLEYALDTIEKLVIQAGPDKLGGLSEVVLLQQPEVIHTVLDFVLRVWQDKLNDFNTDNFEDSAKTAIRLVWDLLHSNQKAMKSMLTQELLKTLMERLYLFKHIVITEEVHTFILLYIVKILRTCAREQAVCLYLVEWSCPTALVQLLEVQQVEVRVPAKALLSHMIPYCGSQTQQLMEKVVLKEDEFQFVLHTLVASCELADFATKNVKIVRLLELFKDLATCPTNHKAFLDRDAENILLQLVHSDSVLTQQVVSFLSPKSDDVAMEASSVPSSSEAISDIPALKPLLPDVHLQGTISSAQDVGLHELADVLLFQLTECIHALLQHTETTQTADESLMVEAMTLANMLATITVLQCDPEQQKPMADHVALATATVLDSLVKLLHLCYTHKFSSDTAGVAAMICDFLHSCLIQWTHHNSAVCKAVIGAGLVYYLLQNLNVQKEKVEFDEYQVEYTQTLLCLLYNIGRHKDNLPAFYPTDSAVSILLPFIHCPLGKIGLFTKCVLSFLQSLMEDNQLFNLELNTDEISFFATSLSTALESDIATANGFTAEEVLTILINLSVMRANQSALQNKEILAALNITIQGQNRMRQRLAIHLLLELIGSSMAKVAIPESTIFTLQALKVDSLSDMRTLAHCLLQSLQHQDACSSGCLLCSEGYYQLGKYEECIEWCNPIISKAKQMEVKQETLNRAKLLKGKALFHSYQKQQLQFMKDRQFIPECEIQHHLKHVYNKAKEAILLLGNALDNDFLDDEGSKLLDFAMMDYMREINQLYDCRRCLLCRRRKEKNDIRQSHFIPKSVLKKLKLGKEIVAEGGNKYLLPLDGRISLKSPGECTFWMLCKVCEQRLSQNGEMDFMDKFFSKVYSDEGPILGSDSVPYDSWLYSFCVGMIFRGLATEHFAAALNADEVYSAFLVCREHLKNLPVKGTAASPLHGEDQTQEQPPSSTSDFHTPNRTLEISLLINPITLERNVDSVRLKQLAIMLKTTGSPFLSTARLCDGKPALSHTVHFFMAHFGNCNIIVKFQPSEETKLPTWSIVDPISGVYTIHEEIQRWEHFPPGFWSAQLAATFTLERVALDFFVRAKAYATASSTSEENVESQIAMGTPSTLEVSDVFISTESVPEVDSTFFSDFCRAPFIVNHLPKGYKITTFNSGFVHTIKLPPDHQFLLHTTIVDKNEGICTTVFLVANSNRTSTYLIGVFSGQHGQIIDWVDVKATKGEDSFTLKNPPEINTSLERETQQKILKVFPQVLKARGFHTFHSVLQQISCRNQCRNLPLLSLDQRCIGGGCWYCVELCNTCMVRPAAPGLSTADEKGEVLKHCSEKCLHSFSIEGVSLPVQIFQPPLQVGIRSALLCALRVNKTVEITGDIIAIVTVYLCLGEPSDARAPHVLVHIRTRLSQQFLEFGITEDLRLAQVPPHLQSTGPRDIINHLETAGALKQLLLPAFQQLGHSGLDNFMTHVMKTLNL